MHILNSTMISKKPELDMIKLLEKNGINLKSKSLDDVIEIIDAIPLTSVGKIFKPILRCDAAKLVVTDALSNEVNLPDAEVDVTIGGARGMCVTVDVPEKDAASCGAVEHALGFYAFETKVRVV